MKLFHCIHHHHVDLSWFQDGELLAVSPGGVREALFSDEYYKLVWNGRLGFAKVAQDAQVVRILSFGKIL